MKVHVVDAAGRPVEGAEVRVPLHVTQTDAEGRATLPPFGFDMGSPRQDHHWKTIVVRAPGYVPVAHWGGRHGAVPEVVRLERRGGRVAGRCVDAAGSPVPGVTLRLVWPAYPDDLTIGMTTDEDGDFACDEAPWEPARLEVVSKSWATDPVEVVPPQEGIDLRLDPRAADVTPPEVEETSSPPPPAPPDPDGAGAWIDVDFTEVSGAYLAVDAVMRDGEVVSLGYLAAEPLVRFPLPAEGLAALLVRDPWGGRGGWRLAAVAGSTVRVRRPSTAPVSLRVVDDSGRTIGGGAANLRWSDLGRVAASESVGANHPSGARRIPDVAPGTYDLVWTPDTGRHTVLLRRGVVMPDPATPLDLRDVARPPVTELLVRVSDGVGPVAGAVVRASTLREAVFARSDLDGLVRLPLADPTRVVLEASHPTRGRAARALSDSELTVRCELVLAP